MNEELVIEMYQSGKTMRYIARELDTNHKLISRVLKKNGIQTREPMNLRGGKKIRL